MPNDQTVTIPLARAWRPSWVRPPPMKRPFVAPDTAEMFGLAPMLANRPIHSEPIHPPTKWTPTTSSESSKPNRYLRLTASAQTAPATRPSSVAAHGVMKPQAGVMATRPATAPEEEPTIVGFPSRIHSTMIQPSSAAAVATWVLTNASAVTPSVVISEPALNPNQPNHSSPAPSATIGTLCGLNLSRGQPTRLPSTRHSASAAEPALMWTAVPPAKSSAWSLLAMNPPPQIQCATGTYTSVNQPNAKTSQPANFVRSEIEPLISATVMIANIIWNARTTYVGIPVVPHSS